ncbi:MAG: hypothetical protein A2622_11555 [Bdellovibrionales bacterium RIFCSPHIGHO2_01_FULL_40_29]|nr:MAG: hypothetical protein A2622_11555 [Bdellovibrionales bacterium RIFCSPHIGHO2_01_FULL_40_29]OFZ34582.1 MAG: hypothetical protein A3D17_01820 [Bdellovibrionales bacterium RIFCSPHIGHO2_02_FULL_40_15]
MKRLLLLVIIGFAATQAHAIGNLNFDFRADMLSQTFNDDAELAAAGKDNYRFYINTARLDYKGNLNEDVSYRARMRLAGKAQGALEIRDNSNPTLDFAYATHKMSDMFKLTVGKLAHDVGGFEGATAGADMYFVSEAYAGTGTSLGAFGGLSFKGYTQVLYGTGAKGTLTFGSHELNLMATNLDTNVGRASVANATAGLSDQNKNMWGLVYKGFMMEKVLGLMASYHTETTKEDYKADWAAVGFQWQAQPILFQLDYALNTATSLTGTTVLKDTLSSIIGKVVYSFDENTAVGAKVASSEELFDGVTTSKNKYMSYGLQAEYKPATADLYRYHVAFNSREETPETGNKRSLQEVIVGMRILGDFLK